MSVLITVNGLVNTFFKELFELPRPPVIEPGISLVYVSGFGFPSGGAETSLLLGLLLIAFWKHRFAWPIGPAPILAELGCPRER